MGFQGVRGLVSRVGLAVAVCLGLASAANAANTLTEAGTSVSNTFELSYSVSGTPQPVITNSLTPPPGGVTQGTPTVFTVDRRVDFVVTSTNAATPAPGANAILTFQVLNEGNDTSAYSFSLADLDSGATTFDATSLVVRYLIDDDDDGIADDGAFAPIAETVIGAGSGSATVTLDVPKGVLVFVEVEGTVASGTLDALTDDITLVAEARDPQSFVLEVSGTPGAVTAGTTGPNDPINDAQNVLADGTGVAAAEAAGDSDGLFAATGVITVAAPNLLASKSVTVIEDPGTGGPLTNCATATTVANAKAVPGSCVEYVIEVQTPGATATASNLDILDILPAQVTFVDASLVASVGAGFTDDPMIGGAGPVLSEPVANSSCDGTNATCQIQLTDAVLAAGETGQIVIRALVK